MALIKKPLEESERWIVVNALYAAAELYRRDATTTPELADQFNKQAADAQAMAERLEDAQDIHVSAYGISETSR